MRAVDTNVLIRLLTRDDAKQVAVAESFIASGAWVSVVVLAETAWVLSATYQLRRAEIARAIEMLLNHEHLTLQDSDAVVSALARFREKPRHQFSDCLVLEIARKAGHLPLGTFDRELARLDGAQRL